MQRFVEADHALDLGNDLGVEAPGAPVLAFEALGRLLGL